MNKQTFKTILITLSFTLVSNSAMAERGSDGDKMQRRGPPPEAIEACSNLNEGDACQFTGRHGDVSGTCFMPPKEDSELACKPSDHKKKD